MSDAVTNVLPFFVQDFEQLPANDRELHLTRDDLKPNAVLWQENRDFLPIEDLEPPYSCWDV